MRGQNRRTYHPDLKNASYLFSKAKKEIEKLRVLHPTLRLVSSKGWEFDSYGDELEKYIFFWTIDDSEIGRGLSEDLYRFNPMDSIQDRIDRIENPELFKMKVEIASVWPSGRVTKEDGEFWVDNARQEPKLREWFDSREEGWAWLHRNAMAWKAWERENPLMPGGRQMHGGKFKVLA